MLKDQLPNFLREEETALKKFKEKHSDVWYFFIRTYECPRKSGDVFQQAPNDDQNRSLAVLIMKIADSFRMAQISMLYGYFHQATILRASVWEATHLFIYFMRDPSVSQKYQSANYDDQIPKILGPGLNQISEENEVYLRDKFSYICKKGDEYKTYQRLCKTKHLHPVVDGDLARTSSTEIEILVGPRKIEDLEKCCGDPIKFIHEPLLTLLVFKDKVPELSKEIENLIAEYRIKKPTDFGKPHNLA